MEPQFKGYDLRLVAPDFASPLTDLIIELDYLRKKRLRGSTPPWVFFQLKHIFHTLESIGSARIEGNNTTIAEYIETKLSDEPATDQGIREIINMEEAMSFIDDNIKDEVFNRAFIGELHKKVVEGLLPPQRGEGDRTPGIYRDNTVVITGSEHKPPDPMQIKDYMEELFEFINKKDASKYDLLKIAMAHHRFLWIHPFNNGNGRTGRLFTYAMLVKQGFNVGKGRILNPTAIFCSNRRNYYRYLSLADTGKEKGILSWCEYVLKGLKDEIEKIDRLLDYDFLKREILLPTIRFSQERQLVTEKETKILKIAIEKPLIKASDLKGVLAGKSPSEISRSIKKLQNKKMLMSLSEGARKYRISFDNNFLLRGIITLLGDKGFLPVKD